jgi:hypothetical protein
MDELKLAIIHSLEKTKGVLFASVRTRNNVLDIQKPVIESPRDLRRLQLLREWSHEQVHQVFP